MAKPDFPSALREADRAMQEIVASPQVERRLRAKLHARMDAKARPRWAVPLGLSLVGAACVVLLMTLHLRPMPQPATATTERVLGGFVIGQASADFEGSTLEDQSLVVEAGQAALIDRAWGGQLVAQRGVRLRHEGERLRLVRGTVEVMVDKRAPGKAPAVLLVSHGAIRVMGTRFTVEQSPDAGRVTLHEGSIVFEGDAGRLVRMQPGDSLRWPLVTPVPTPEAPAPRPVVRRAREEAGSDSAPTEVRDNIEVVLERVATLRSRGDYRACVEELTRAAQGAEPDTAERLSFEIGSILTNQLHERARACAHWSEHQRRFSGARYRTEIQQAKERAECQPIGTEE